jgi:hypothetical protein
MTYLYHTKPQQHLRVVTLKHSRDVQFSARLIYCLGFILRVQFHVCPNAVMEQWVGWQNPSTSGIGAVMCHHQHLGSPSSPKTHLSIPCFKSSISKGSEKFSCKPASWAIGWLCCVCSNGSGMVIPGYLFCTSGSSQNKSWWPAATISWIIHLSDIFEMAWSDVRGIDPPPTSIIVSLHRRKNHSCVTYQNEFLKNCMVWRPKLGWRD